MPEDTNTTPEITSAPVPENVIPLPVEASVAPLESLVSEPHQQPASDVSETPAASQTTPTEDPVLEAIKGIDLDKITKDDIFVDIIHQSKLHAFRLMVGAALLEQLIIKGRNETPANE